MLRPPPPPWSASPAPLPRCPTPAAPSGQTVPAPRPGGHGVEGRPAARTEGLPGLGGCPPHRFPASPSHYFVRFFGVQASAPLGWHHFSLTWCRTFLFGFSVFFPLGVFWTQTSPDTKVSLSFFCHSLANNLCVFRISICYQNYKTTKLQEHKA